MSNGLVRDQADHAPKLLDSFVVLTGALVSDSQVEPCVRNCRVLLLRAYQLCNTSIRLTGTQKGQPVIDALPYGVRVELQRSAKLIHCLEMSVGILIKR